ncbi:unnamed protein product [Prorocentrum cordatum]|uniref:Protein kinase domain-containing protein n=1 Tax=Prorocentrum cordatum TaxID=2364126 RepID=A0ABN9PH19_9DINO|nr:unnamed protein product [Polarella glacialis]
MKAFKDRMKKMNLTVVTKPEGTSRTSRPGQSSPPTLLASKASTADAPKAGAQRPPRKLIAKVSDADVASMYEIKGQVMESTHQGMQVLFGKRRSDGLQVVVKTREKPASFKGGWEEREWRETTVVQLNMPKIESMCEYIEVFETTSKYYVVMERVNGMDLFEHLQQGRIKQEDARQILHQMLTALDSMHSAGRIHKDLKLENVVVDLASPKVRRCNSNGSMTSVEAKLIDFDTVQDWEPTSPKAKDVLGTDGYIAPEAYTGEYSPASDIYCVGVIMYKLLTGRSPSRSDIQGGPGENWVGSPAMKRIQDRLRKETVDFARPPLNRSPEAQRLVRSMMAFDPNERPTAAEALESRWFHFVGDEPPRDPSHASVEPARAGSDTRSPAGASDPSPPAADKLALPGEPE